MDLEKTLKRTAIASLALFSALAISACDKKSDSGGGGGNAVIADVPAPASQCFGPNNVQPNPAWSTVQPYPNQTSQGGFCACPQNMMPACGPQGLTCVPMQPYNGFYVASWNYYWNGTSASFTWQNQFVNPQNTYGFRRRHFRGRDFYRNDQDPRNRPPRHRKGSRNDNDRNGENDRDDDDGRDDENQDDGEFDPNDSGHKPGKGGHRFPNDGEDEDLPPVPNHGRPGLPPPGQGQQPNSCQNSVAQLCTTPGQAYGAMICQPIQPGSSVGVWVRR